MFCLSVLRFFIYMSIEMLVDLDPILAANIIFQT